MEKQNTSEVDRNDSDMKNRRLTFEEMYEKYLRYVARCVCSNVQCPEDREEIIQATFVRAWQAFEKIEQRQLGGFLARIATNLCKDYWRHQQCLRRLEICSLVQENGTIIDLADIHDDIEDAYIQRETIDAALNRLSPYFREMIDRHIAGHPIGPEKVRASRARKRFRELLEEEGAVA